MIGTKKYSEKIGHLLKNSPACLWGEGLERLTEDVRWFGRGVPTGVFSPFPDLLIFQPISGVTSRLEAVNQYFSFKAGQVLGSNEALKLLAELHERQVIPTDEWEQFNTCKNAFALAMLSAAGFCEVSEHAIGITEAGKQFLADLLE